MSSAARSHLPGEMKPVFNIILLGNSGTGKSASGNTLLKAAKRRRNPGQHFASYPSSTPVTTACEQIVVNMFGRCVGVVDTPDFFNDDKPADEAQIQECKKYFRPRQFVILLVIQLGRFNDGERGILDKLENEFGWKIRNNTIILFTHGDDLHCNVEEFISDRSHFRDIVEACGDRYHVFNNNSKDSKQVKALIERFEPMFPNFRTKKSFKLFNCN